MGNLNTFSETYEGPKIEISGNFTIKFREGVISCVYLGKWTSYAQLNINNLTWVNIDGPSEVYKQGSKVLITGDIKIPGKRATIYLIYLHRDGSANMHVDTISGPADLVGKWKGDYAELKRVPTVTIGTHNISCIINVYHKEKLELVICHITNEQYLLIRMGGKKETATAITHDDKLEIQAANYNIILYMNNKLSYCENDKITEMTWMGL